MINLTIDEVENLAKIIVNHVEDGQDSLIKNLEQYYDKLSSKTKYSGFAYRIVFLSDLKELKQAVEYNRSWSLHQKSAFLFLKKRRLEGEVQNAYLLKAKIKGIKVNPIVLEIQDQELFSLYSNEDEVIATELISDINIVKEL